MTLGGTRPPDADRGRSMSICVIRLQRLSTWAAGNKTGMLRIGEGHTGESLCRKVRPTRVIVSQRSVTWVWTVKSPCAGDFLPGDWHDQILKNYLATTSMDIVASTPSKSVALADAAPTSFRCSPRVIAWRSSEMPVAVRNALTMSDSVIEPNSRPF